jgi:SEC-C motif
LQGGEISDAERTRYRWTRNRTDEFFRELIRGSCTSRRALWNDEARADAQEIAAKIGLLSNIKRFESVEPEYPRVRDREMKKGRNRNQPCTCGSGRKYKVAVAVEPSTDCQRIVSRGRGKWLRGPATIITARDIQCVHDTSAQTGSAEERCLLGVKPRDTFISTEPVCKSHR